MDEKQKQQVRVGRRSRKKQKKALKKALAAEEVAYKAPSLSKNPARRVAKNILPRQTVRDSLLEKVFLSIVAPNEYPPVRLGSQYGSFETNAANPNFAVVPAFVGLESPSSLVDSVGFAFRDPARAFITPYVDSTAWLYTGDLSAEAVNGIPSPLLYSPLVFNGAAGTTQVHGSAIFPGRFNKAGRMYLWMDVGNNLVFTNTATSAATLVPYTYRSDGVIDAGAGIAMPASGSVLYTATQMGYVGFDIFSLANFTVTGTLNLSRGTATSGFGHYSIPFYYANLPSVESIKIYGVSMMYTNEAAPINRQGKIAAVQLANGDDWRNYLGYNTISGLKNPYRICADNGVYGFLKPTQPSDFAFSDQSDLIGTRALSWFDLETPSDFLAIQIKITTLAGQDGYFTLSYAFEIRTLDPWREVKGPEVSFNVVETSLTLVSAAPQWHENPFHISDIWDWLKQAAADTYSAIKEALPTVIKTANTVASIGAAVAPLL
jgi:hypothetical protein